MKHLKQFENIFNILKPKYKINDYVLYNYIFTNDGIAKEIPVKIIDIHNDDLKIQSELFTFILNDGNYKYDYTWTEVKIYIIRKITKTEFNILTEELKLKLDSNKYNL